MKRFVLDVSWYIGDEYRIGKHFCLYEIHQQRSLSSAMLLKFQRVERKQIWGFDADRTFPRDQFHVFGLVKADGNNSCKQCQYEKLRGFENASPGSILEITPTISAGRTELRLLPSDNGLSSGKADYDAGVTVNYSPTENFTVSGAVNPDFSPVESDAFQLELNQPFAITIPRDGNSLGKEQKCVTQRSMK